MKFLVVSIVLLYLIAIGSCAYLPYNGYPNSAAGRAIGGPTPQASGYAANAGLGPSINVNPVNNAESQSNSEPSNYQQANITPSGGSQGCGYGGLFC